MHVLNMLNFKPETLIQKALSSKLFTLNPTPYVHSTPVSGNRV